MMQRSSVLPVAAGLLMTACATIPTGPSVMVLPGSGKPFEQFQADDAVCRQWAAQQTGTTTERASTRSSVSGAAIGTVLGATAGAAVGAAAGSPDRKSTRLNSSHVEISYAVFCLKKKRK